MLGGLRVEEFAVVGWGDEEGVAPGQAGDCDLWCCGIDAVYILVLIFDSEIIADVLRDCVCCDGWGGGVVGYCYAFCAGFG